jgi:uncharacterized protein YoxC
MISWSAAGLWLLQPGTLPDTQIVRQVTADPGLFDKITSVASGLMTISILVLTVALVPAAWNFRKSYQKISDLLDRVYGDINPIMRHASTIADNLNYVTTSLRADVQQVNQTVNAANERVLQAVRITERRLNEFNALLGVVQEEAEQAFVNTAAVVRGVRTGANHFGDDLRFGMAEERIEEMDEELAEALDEAFDTGEDNDDGIDDPDRSPRGTEYPRIRPRGRA